MNDKEDHRKQDCSRSQCESEQIGGDVLARADEHKQTHLHTWHACHQQSRLQTQFFETQIPFLCTMTRQSGNKEQRKFPFPRPYLHGRQPRESPAALSPKLRASSSSGSAVVPSGALGGLRSFRANLGRVRGFQPLVRFPSTDHIPALDHPGSLITVRIEVECVRINDCTARRRLCVHVARTRANESAGRVRDAWWVAISRSNKTVRVRRNGWRESQPGHEWCR